MYIIYASNVFLKHFKKSDISFLNLNSNIYVILNRVELLPNFKFTSKSVKLVKYEKA